MTVGNSSLVLLVDQYQSAIVRITRGRGAGQERQITGNTATTGYYFIISGAATLNGGTTLYNFTLTGSLPNTAVAGSKGGLGFQVSGANGFSYALPFTNWDDGESVTVKTT